MPFAQKPTPRLSPSGMESRIRRAAEKAGLRAVKSRWLRGTVHNKGGWQIIDPKTGAIVSGKRYELTDAAALERFQETPRETIGNPE